MVSNPTSSQQLAERFYHTLLWVYPAVYRREYGTLMTQLFRDLCHDAHRQGLIGVMRLWVRVLKDIAVTAIAEHIHTLQEGEQTMSKRQHWLILSLAGGPLWLGLFLLFWLDPGNTRDMIVPNAMQPLGWLMTAAILGLTAGAYVIQRKVMQAAVTETSAGVTQNRSMRRGLAFVGSILFMVLPALLLVVFGPVLIDLLLRGLLPYK